MHDGALEEAMALWLCRILLLCASKGTSRGFPHLGFPAACTCEVQSTTTARWSALERTREQREVSAVEGSSWR